MSANASAFMTALGNGSRGAGMRALGDVGGGLSALFGGAAARTLSKSDAAAERFTADQIAAADRRATRQAVGTARAATAASGAALDQFAQPLISDIETRGAHDEAMAILGGETRAAQTTARGNAAALGSLQEASGSLLRAASFAGWKGTKGPTLPWYDGTSGDFTAEY